MVNVVNPLRFSFSPPKFGTLHVTISTQRRLACLLIRYYVLDCHFSLLHTCETNLMLFILLFDLTIFILFVSENLYLFGGIQMPLTYLGCAEYNVGSFESQCVNDQCSDMPRGLALALCLGT